MPHNSFFSNNCPAILKVLGSHANIFLFQWVKRGFLWLHLTFISGSEMRPAPDVWCARGFDKKTQIAIEPTSTLKVCRWNPHFCQDLGVEFWVGVTDTDKRFILVCYICFGSRVYSVQLMSITIEGPCCPHGWCLGTQLRVWFQLPENCLWGDTEGDC